MKGHRRKSVGGSIEFTCDRGDCGKTFDSKTDLERHLGRHDNNFQKCFFCPWASQTHNRMYISAHYDHHSNQPRFKCEICEKQFFVRYDMEKHFENSHEKIEGRYKCKICSFRGHSRVHLANHMKCHQFSTR